MTKIITYICDFCGDDISETNEANKKDGIGIEWVERMYQGVGKKEILKEVKFAESERHLCKECITKVKNQL